MCWRVDLFQCPRAFKAVTERRGHGGSPEENMLMEPANAKRSSKGRRRMACDPTWHGDSETDSKRGWASAACDI